MRLTKRKNQHRRDFVGVYKCESCGATQERFSYDDANYHENVIPAMECRMCGQSTRSLGCKPAPYKTRYAEHEVI